MGRGNGGDAGDAVDGFVGEVGDDMVVYDGDVVGWWGCGEEIPRGVDDGVCGIHALLDCTGVEEPCQTWANSFEIPD